MEEVAGLCDGALDQHAPGIAVDQPGGGGGGLVGAEQGGLVVAEFGDGELADAAGVALESDGLVEHARASR